VVARGGLVGRGVLVDAAEEEAYGGLVVGEGGVLAGEVGVPDLFAVVAEGGVAVGPHAVELGAVGATAGDDGVGAVGCGAPASVGDCDEDAAQHEFFVLLDEDRRWEGICGCLWIENCKFIYFLFLGLVYK